MITKVMICAITCEVSIDFYNLFVYFSKPRRENVTFKRESLTFKLPWGFNLPKTMVQWNDHQMIMWKAIPDLRKDISNRITQPEVYLLYRFQNSRWCRYHKHVKNVKTLREVAGDRLRSPERPSGTQRKLCRCVKWKTLRAPLLFRPRSLFDRSDLSSFDLDPYPQNILPWLPSVWSLYISMYM